ncbi:hypothetical protein [Duganella vulcania]|uniref:Uncharacterized protein n=1 Tax=Duganella vulcania TaxID=2692166 RepID=A0A845GG61_9BURK|nr:hypothetical protein [Duganella vulcania]MYM92500.1 hypothetical protein [Duganella vulcania]
MKQLPNLCTQMRRKLVQRKILNLGTGVSSDEGQEWRTEPCNVPMFTDEERQRGTCASCASGWTHAHNFALKTPRNKTERFLLSFQSVPLRQEHRNYNDQTPALRDLGMAPSIATALIRWGETECLVCKFENARGHGPNAYSWQPAFLKAAFHQHIEMFGEVGKGDLTPLMQAYADEFVAR